MALRALMLGKRLSEKQKELDAVREQIAGFDAREAELAQAIEEAETEEEKAAVEEAVETFEKEKEEAAEKVESLENEVRELEEDLEKVEAPAPAEPVEERKEEHREERMIMKKRFKDMTYAEKTAIIQRDDVQKFLGEVRQAIKEKRTVTNAGYLVPTVLLDLLRENIENYSKLYGRVNVKQVAGAARQVIQGTIPEAVWTEACATLNELNLSFSKVEVDGYKVGGYFRVCNATLEDSDENLTAILTEALGQAIGLALDKAILYGTGTKMPVGVLTALAAVTDTPNIVSIAATYHGADLLKQIVLASAKAKGKYSRGVKSWAMNESTYTTLLAEFTALDSSGAYVSMVNGVMPVVGGDIVVLDYIPDNTIIGGYYDLYLLAERAGTRIRTSEEAFFIEDQTGFMGTARYDGKVLVDNSFVAIGLNGTTPDPDDVTFAPDSANPGE